VLKGSAVLVPMVEKEEILMDKKKSRKLSNIN
jgi:hypothetical protein